MNLIPYAGTEMYEEALKEGYITEDYWRDYALKPVPHFMPPQLIENTHVQPVVHGGTRKLPNPNNKRYI